MFISAAALLAVLGGLSTCSARSSAWSRNKGLPPIEYLMVPSASMQRQIKVEFQARRHPCRVPARRHARRTTDYNGWDKYGSAFEWFEPVGPVRSILPTGGAGELLRRLVPASFGVAAMSKTYKWQTFLTQELPAVARGEQGDQPVEEMPRWVCRWPDPAALILAAKHPENFIYAASMSGFLQPVRRAVALAGRCRNDGGRRAIAPRT